MLKELDPITRKTLENDMIKELVFYKKEYQDKGIKVNLMDCGAEFMFKTEGLGMTNSEFSDLARRAEVVFESNFVRKQVEAKDV